MLQLYRNKLLLCILFFWDLLNVELKKKDDKMVTPEGDT